jgi:hypothetical protein
LESEKYKTPSPKVSPKQKKNPKELNIPPYLKLNKKELQKQKKYQHTIKIKKIKLQKKPNEKKSGKKDDDDDEDDDDDDEEDEKKPKPLRNNFKDEL